MASNLGLRPPRNDCTTTCWRLRLPTSSPASPGRFSTRGAPSSASREMRSRPDPLDPRAVLGPVKAWPGNAGARGKASATASLDDPLRAARLHAQAGTKEQPSGTNKGTGRNEEQWMREQPPFPAEVCERMRRDGGSVFPARANTGDPNGPVGGLSANEIARALISMMARSTTCSNQRPDTLMRDRICRIEENL